MFKTKIIFSIFIRIIIQIVNANNRDPLQYFLLELRTFEAKFTQVLIN